MGGCSAKHGIGTGGANIGAGLHQRDMRLFGMFTTLTKAVLDGFDTDLMAALTVIDALIHVRASMFGSVVAHVASP